MAVLKRESNGTGVQGFAPTSIVAVSAGSVDVSSWLAFCFPSDEVTYQINDAGETATLPAGTIRVVHDSVNSITFSGITTASCEVM